MPLTKLSRKYHLLKKSKLRPQDPNDEFDKENKDINFKIFNQKHQDNKKHDISVIPETSSSSENDSPIISNEPVFQSRYRTNALQNKNRHSSPDSSNSNCKDFKTDGPIPAPFSHFENRNVIKRNMQKPSQKSVATEGGNIGNDITQSSEISYLDCQNWKRFESTHIDHLAGVKEHNITCFTEDLSNILQITNDSSDNGQKSNDESYHSVKEHISSDPIIQPQINNTSNQKDIVNKNKDIVEQANKCDEEYGRIDRHFNRKTLKITENNKSSIIVASKMIDKGNYNRILAIESEEDDELSISFGISKNKKNRSSQKISQKSRKIERRSMLGRNEVILLSSETDSSIDDSKCTYRSKCCWKKHILKRAPLPKLPGRIDYRAIDELNQRPDNQEGTSSNTFEYMNTYEPNILSESRIANIKQWIEASPFQPHKAVNTSKTVQIDSSSSDNFDSSSSETENDSPQEEKSSHPMNRNSGSNLVQSNSFSHGTSKQEMPQSSDPIFKSVLVGSRYMQPADCANDNQDVSFMKNRNSARSAAIPHFDVENNNPMSPKYIGFNNQKYNKAAMSNKNHQSEGNIGIHSSIHELIEEQSCQQTDNTYSEDVRTSKDQLESSSSIDEGLKKVLENDSNTSVIGYGSERKQLSDPIEKRNENVSQEQRQQIATEEDQSKQTFNDLCIFPNTKHIIDKGNEFDETLNHSSTTSLPNSIDNSKKMIHSKVDKENQAMLSESSDEDINNSPSKISVCLQISLSESENNGSHIAISKSLSRKDDTDSSHSNNCNEQNAFQSSDESFNTRNLESNLNCQNRVSVTSRQNYNPTQELKLILSSDSELDEQSSKHETKNASVHKTKIHNALNNLQSSKTKNVFGNYVSLSEDEEDDEFKSTSGREKLALDGVNEPSYSRNFTSFGESNDKQEVNNSRKEPHPFLSENNGSSKLITSKLVQNSSACFQGANGKEKGSCLTNKSIQVQNSEDDTTTSDISFKEDAKNNGLMRLLSSHTEEEKEAYLDKEHSSSKCTDPMNPHGTKGSLNKKKPFQPSLLSGSFPSLTSFVKIKECSMTFLASLSLEDANNRYNHDKILIILYYRAIFQDIFFKTSDRTIYIFL